MYFIFNIFLFIIILIFILEENSMMRKMLKKEQFIFGIIGYGTVGQATGSMIRVPYKIYDINKKYSCNFNELLNCSYLFICVNTSYNDNLLLHNYDNLENVLNDLVKKHYKGIVIVRTTCAASFLEKYENLLNIVVMPEFLNQNSAFSDEQKCKYIILGGDYCHAKKVEKVLDEHTYYNYVAFEFCTIKEAMDVKLMRNLYGAYKILFWNFVQEYTGNARKIYQLMEYLPDQGDMQIVGMDGEKGYGGKCFPKDVKIVDDDCLDRKFTSFMISYNSYLKSHNKV